MKSFVDLSGLQVLVGLRCEQSAIASDNAATNVENTTVVSIAL